MKDGFGSDYFGGRSSMEQKHYIEVMNWLTEFKPKSVLFYGCGMGQRVAACEYFGVEAVGYDPYVRLFKSEPTGKFDLVVCYDVLEHVKACDVKSVLGNIGRFASKHILFSVCLEGDLNASRDPTHVTIKPAQFWLARFVEMGWLVHKVPEQFLFREQMFLVEVKKK